MKKETDAQNFSQTTRLFTESQIRMALRLYYVGSESCAPGHSFGPAVRPHYLIHFIRSGKGRYIRKGTVHHLQAGDAFLILPGETTKYIADEKDPWEYTWVAFDGPDAKALLKHCNFSDQNVIYHSPGSENAGQLASRASSFEYSFRENGQNLFEVMGSFYLLFSCMYKEQPPIRFLSTPENPHSDDTIPDFYFAQAVEYLKHNFAYPVKIEQLASHIGISRTYLYKIFISHSGKSIQQYLLDLRLESAIEMLCHSGRGITEIACSCGFPDSPSFCRQFKKQTNFTPLQYRKVWGGSK